MHRPVRAVEFGELPGAVERVDDPHPLRRQSHRVVDTLFGEHGVAGTLGGQRRHQEVVGALVPRGFPVLRGSVGEFGADVEQQPAGLGGQQRRQFMVGHWPRLSSSSMTAAASSSGLRSGVSRRSGFFGRW